MQSFQKCLLLIKTLVGWQWMKNFYIKIKSRKYLKRQLKQILKKIIQTLTQQGSPTFKSPGKNKFWVAKPALHRTAKFHFNLTVQCNGNLLWVMELSKMTLKLHYSITHALLLLHVKNSGICNSISLPGKISWGQKSLLDTVPFVDKVI